LVSDVQEAWESIEIVSLALEEVLVGLVVFVGTTFHDDVFPLSQADLLEALPQKQKQCGHVSLLVHGQAQNDLHFEVMKHLREEELGATVGLVGHNASGTFFTIYDGRNLDTIGLFQAVFDRLVGQPVGAQQGPLVLPVELG